MKRAAILVLIAGMACVSFERGAFAVGSAGYENASFSAEALSQGNAVTARPEEPASISYNPAGIAELPGLQIQANSSFISIFTYFDSTHSNLVSDTRSSGTISPVPTGYITLNPKELLGGRVAFGVGTDSPFGLMNKYNSTHPTTQFAGHRNWLKMYTIKPTLAVKFTDWLSAGIGPMFYRIYDFGGIQAYPNRLIAAAFADGQVRLNLSGQHWGWHMGLLAKPHRMHQLGFYFRSPVVVPVSGLIKVENATAGAALSGGRLNFETGGDAKMTFPLNFTWAYAFKPTDRAAVEFDFGYTRWSTFERLFINHHEVGTIDDTILNAIGRVDKDYRDSFNYHLGGSYRLRDNFKLMAGGWFYTSAGPNSSFIPAIPDSPRLGYGFGMSYLLNKFFRFDAAYLNFWSLRRKIDNDIASGIGGTEDGNWHSYGQEFTISTTFMWDNFGADLMNLSGKKETEAKPAEDLAIHFRGMPEELLMMAKQETEPFRQAAPVIQEQSQTQTSQTPVTASEQESASAAPKAAAPLIRRVGITLEELRAQGKLE